MTTPPRHQVRSPRDAAPPSNSKSGDAYVDRLADRLASSSSPGSELGPPAGESADDSASVAETVPPPARRVAGSNNDLREFAVGESTVVEDPEAPQRRASIMNEVPDPAAADSTDEAPPIDPGDGADASANGHDPESDADPFAPFEEDPLASEATRIETQNFLAEQTTHILQEEPPQPYLEVESGRDRGKTFALHPGETGVGRSIDNDVILTDIAVSRRHLKIVREGDGLRIRDLGSGNGSIVNGRRVYDAPLHEGDRIDLGETVLVVRIPGPGGVGAPPLPPFPGSPTPNVVLEQQLARDPTGSPPLHAPGAIQHGGFATPLGFGAGSVSQQPTWELPKPFTLHGRPIVVPRIWMYGALAAGGLLVLLLGIGIVSALVGSGDDETPLTAADDPSMRAGIDSFRAGRWAEAERSFAEAAVRNPADPTIPQYLQRSRDAIAHERIVAAAEAALRAGEPATALNTIAVVPATSPLGARVAAIQQQARAALVSARISAGRASLQGGDVAAARRALEDARRIDPGSAMVSIFAVELTNAQASAPVGPPQPESDPTAVAATDDTSRGSRGSSSSSSSSGSHERSRHEDTRETRRSGSGSSSSSGGGGASASSSSSGSGSGSGSGSSGGASAAQARAVTAYRGGDFAGAVRTARAAADSASASDARTLNGLADKMERFASDYARVRAAGSNTASVLRQLESAVSLDERISGGYYARQLRPTLVDAYLASARVDWPRGQYSNACGRVRQALEIDPRNAQARDLGSRCEQRARQMLTDAQHAESADRTRAQGIYRDIIKMVPTSSETYRTAYTRLNALSRRSTVDEDE